MSPLPAYGYYNASTRLQDVVPINCYDMLKFLTLPLNFPEKMKIYSPKFCAFGIKFSDRPKLGWGRGKCPFLPCPLPRRH